MPNDNSGRPSIVHIVTSRLSVRTILRAKIRGLARRGYRQWVISADDGGPADLPDGVSLLNVPIPRAISPAGDLSALWQIVRLLERHRPDVVHTRTGKAGLVGRLAAKIAGAPLVIHTVHGLPYPGERSPIVYHLQQSTSHLMARATDYLLSQNRRDYYQLLRRRSLSPWRIGYEGNGVDLAALQGQRDPAIRARVRGQYGVRPDQVLCVMLARFEPVKRVDRLINALPLTTQPNLRVLICGDGCDRASLEAQAVHLGVTDRIIFAGWIRNSWDAIAASDVMCLTSHKEGLPRSLMEAMAIGRPTLATDVPGTNEVVAHGETGYLVQPDDAAGLAAALDRLVAEPQTRQAMAAAGIKRVARYFNEEDVLERLDLVYRQLSRGIVPSLPPPDGTEPACTGPAPAL